MLVKKTDQGSDKTPIDQNLENSKLNKQELKGANSLSIDEQIEILAEIIIEQLLKEGYGKKQSE